MKTTYIAAAGAIIALAGLLTSTAEAGVRVRLGFGGPLPAFTAYGNGGGSPSAYRAKRKKAARKHVTRKQIAKKPAAPKRQLAATKRRVPAKAVVSAKPADQGGAVTARRAVESENSSITVAKADDQAKADIEATGTPEATPKADCKQFFPSVGMTLTVPCE